jgi:hypothetical protein
VFSSTSSSPTQQPQTHSPIEPNDWLRSTLPLGSPATCALTHVSLLDSYRACTRVRNRLPPSAACGNPAVLGSTPLEISVRPEALRPRLSASLPFELGPMLRQPRTGVKQSGRIRQTGERETGGDGASLIPVLCPVWMCGDAACAKEAAISRRPRTRMPPGPRLTPPSSSKLLCLRWRVRRP